MVAIPGGKYIPAAATPGTVPQEVAPLLMAETEITQFQYQAIMGVNPSQVFCLECPVTGVTWYDAMLYCTALSERLGPEGILPPQYPRLVPAWGNESHPSRRLRCKPAASARQPCATAQRADRGRNGCQRLPPAHRVGMGMGRFRRRNRPELPQPLRPRCDGLAQRQQRQLPAVRSGTKDAHRPGRVRPCGQRLGMVRAPSKSRTRAT